MKKLFFRIISLMLVVNLVVAPAVVFAAESEDTTVQPRYTNITSIAAAVNINSLGKAVCTSSAMLTYTSDTGKLIMYLQKLDGNTWYTVKSWTDTADPYYMSGSYYVYSGYYYRCKAVLTVYDSSGNIVDAGQAISQSVYYG